MSGSRVRTSLLAALIALISVMGVAYAATLIAPAGRPILTISGKISATNKDSTAQFDRPTVIPRVLPTPANCSPGNSYTTVIWVIARSAS